MEPSSSRDVLEEGYLRESSVIESESKEERLQPILEELLIELAYVLLK